MSAVAQTTYSGEKYLQMEVKADCKSEYFRREIFMMAGATPNHHRIQEKSWSIDAILQLSDLYDGTDNVNEGWTTPEE
jgi:hypothetical protein